jgi:hypothetical protein
MGISRKKAAKMIYKIEGASPIEKVLNKEIKALQESIILKDWEIMKLRAEIDQLKTKGA